MSFVRLSSVCVIVLEDHAVHDYSSSCFIRVAIYKKLSTPYMKAEGIKKTVSA